MIGAVVLAVLGTARPQTTPIVVPLEALGEELAVRVRIGGKERRVLLTTASENAYLKQAPDEPVEFEIGGRNLGKFRFFPPGPGSAVSGEEGGLGTGLLKDMALGIDVIKRQLTLWPKGGLPKEDAETWIKALPPLDGPLVVRRLPAERLPGKALSLDAQIGGKRTPLLLRLGFNGSFLEPGVSRPAIPVGGYGALLPPLSVAGLPPNWFYYKPAPAGLLDERLFGVKGAVSVDAFGSRRILVDFAESAVYVEELSPEQRWTDFLTRFTRVPLTVRAKGIFVEFPGGEGASLMPELVPFVGSQALSIGDEPAGGWQGDLMGQDEAAARSLAERLRKLFKSFTIQVLTPQGRELPINVAVNETN